MLRAIGGKLSLGCTLVAIVFSTLLRTAHAALPAPDPDDGAITLPPGFRALVVADNLVANRKIGRNPDRLRFLTIATNGDIYVKSYFQGILALRDTNGDGRADVIQEFSSGPGTCVAIHDGWLYYSTRTGVYRYKYTPGELVPSGEPQTIVAGLPAERDHDAKCFAFDDQGRILVEVGSPYNVYSDGDRRRGAKGKDATEFQKTYGGFWRFDADKTNQTQADGFHFSTGHRHCLAVVWHPASTNFFMVMMGRDGLNDIDPEHYDALDNAERVAEEMHLLRQDVNLGWPYTYWDPIKNARMVAPEFGGDNHKRDENPAYDKPLIAFPAHWAPLQMVLYTGNQFPEKYRGGMFLAFHGSWNRAPRPQAGYKVVFIPFDEKGMPTRKYETFADGFAGVEYFVNTRDARFRPCGVAVGPDGSLYVTDTEKGRIWRIIYTGETSPLASRKSAIASAQSALPIGADTPGGMLYQQLCAACHMPTGTGVPNMQPALAGSPVVAGDPTQLINVLLRGPAVVLPADREKFSNVMPPFAFLTNDQIATVLTYIREQFGARASAIQLARVAAIRSQLDKAAPPQN